MLKHIFTIIMLVLLAAQHIRLNNLQRKVEEYKRTKETERVFVLARDSTVFKVNGAIVTVNEHK